nr:integrase core domain-containing protein [Spirochaeta cellobiosiphila]
MDGKGRALDNVFVERLWRSVKQEDVYLKEYRDIRDAKRHLTKYFEYYNKRRRHQALDDEFPEDIYYGRVKLVAA